MNTNDGSRCCRQFVAFIYGPASKVDHPIPIFGFLLLEYDHGTKHQPNTDRQRFHEPFDIGAELPKVRLNEIFLFIETRELRHCVLAQCGDSAGGIAISVGVGQVETGFRIPRIAGHHHDNGTAVSGLFFAPLGYFQRRDVITVERDRLRMKVADVAGERNCESRPYDPKGVHEASDVFLSIMKAQLRRIFSLVTDGITLRGRMAAQQKVDAAMTFQDLTKSQTGHMTIVEIQERQTTAFDNKSAVVESVLIGIQREISAKMARCTVR